MARPSDALIALILSPARFAGHTPISRTTPPKRVHLRSDGSVDMPATMLDPANRAGVETGRSRSDQPNVAAAPRSADLVAEVIPPTTPTFFHDECSIDPTAAELIPRFPPAWEATALLAAAMDKARDENPRGDVYRTYPQERLLNMLSQNMEEFVIALRYGNDVSDKAADVANFVAFILHNYINPTTKGTQ